MDTFSFPPHQMALDDGPYEAGGCLVFPLDRLHDLDGVTSACKDARVHESHNEDLKVLLSSGRRAFPW
jgi:hypothetical protein